MRPNKVIALTGGIGSGKSAVAAILEEYGCFVVDCDAITKQIYKDRGTAERVSDAFGGGFMTDGGLDFKKLGAYVFRDAQRVARLNAITHPLIFGRLKEILDGCGKDVAFVQIPLLFETGRQNDFDEIWLVTAGEKTRAARVSARDGIDGRQVADRIKNQLPDEKKAPFAHTIIKNDGTLDDLRAQVKARLTELKIV